MDFELNILKKLIGFIEENYISITNEWNKINVDKINLKKNCVYKIDSDGRIYVEINNYINFLNDNSIEFQMELDEFKSKYNCNIRSRIKAQNSVESKIQGYRKSQSHECGKTPINKCLNDLFGIRIIFNNPITYEDISSFIEKEFDNKYKCIDSSKGTYKATHIYFKQDNYSFNWELQIWNSCDNDANIKSHKEYKQGYTTWEKENKEGGITNV